MSRRDPDPVDAWLDVSARAARATSYRPVTERGSGRSGAWSLVVTTVALAVIATGLALRPAPPSVATVPPTASMAASPTPSGPMSSAAPVVSAPSDSPVSAVDDDGMFRLELSTPFGIYGQDGAIAPVAHLTYVGPDAAVTFGHSDPAVVFTIEEIGGGGRQMTGGANDICLSTTLRRDEPSTIPFRKSGQSGLGFDLAWFRDPVLRLPAGTWRIRARLEAYVPECAGDADIHTPIAENLITVE